MFPFLYYKRLIKGELSNILGAKLLNSDIKMRVLNIVGNAKKNYQFLNQESKNLLSWYCEGFNEYLRVGKDEYPVELGMLGLEPEPLTI